MNKLWIIVCLFFLTGYTQAQDLQGKIYSATDSLPIPGVSVAVNNKTVATTDAAGNFRVTLVKGNYTLTLKSIGFRDTTLNIIMPTGRELIVYLQLSSNTIDEVVINTGYQILPKERATGSFVTLSNAKLNEQISTDILSRIESIANGVSFENAGSVNNLMVRGLSTIGGPKKPLIILDNFPYQGDPANINPNDIESITILKDAAAASIWGSQAGNGVIVLTSKRARAGQTLQIEFNTNFTVSPKPDLFSLRTLSSASTIEVEQMLFSKGFYDSKINGTAKAALSPVVELLAANRSGALTTAALNEQLAVLRNVDVRKEILDKNYNEPIKRQYSLNLRGSGKSLLWSLSGGYDENTSELDAKSTRLTLNSRNTVTLLKNLQLEAGLRMARNNTGDGKVGYAGLAQVSTIYPYLQLADANGNPLPIAKSYSQSYLNTLAATSKLLDWNYYPLTEHLYNHDSITEEDLTANIGLNYKFLKAFKISLNYQHQKAAGTDRTLYDAESYTVRNSVNHYTQVDGAGILSYKVPKGGIMDKIESQFTVQNLRGQLDFNKDWNKHSVTFLAGGELNDANYEEQGSRVYGYNDATLAYVPVDHTVSYTTYVAKSKSFISQGATGFSSTLKRFVSVFANGAYTYNNKYTVSGSMRQDASNLYGVKTNEKWKPLWSTGVSWLLSEESFYKISWLPYLKLRATYGFAGNVDPSKTAVTTITAFGSASVYTNSTYSRFSNYANPDLRWETVGTLNLGADFSLLNNRLSGSIEVYRKTATDLYGNSPNDYTAVPDAALTKNIASIRAEGFDMALSIHAIKGKINLYTDLNFNLYRDRVMEYNVFSMQGINFVGATSIGPEGYPVVGVYSFKWGGLNPVNGAPQGYLAGKLSSDYAQLTGAATLFSDIVYHGSGIPTTYGSIGNTIEYKNISLTVRASYKFGYWFKRKSLSYSNLYAGVGFDPDYDLRWKTPGDELTTNVPALVYPADSRRDSFYTRSEALAERGDHIRLEYISLAYAISKQQMRKLPVSSVKLQFNVSNPGLLWAANSAGIDPRYNGSIVPGRNYSIGLRCTL